MEGTYSVKILSDAEAQQAYPLVQAVVPTIGLERWKTFFRSGPHRRSDESLIGVFDGVHHLRGIVAVSILDHLDYGRTAHVPIFIVLSVADPSGAADALVRAIERIGFDHRAGHIIISMDAVDGAARRHLLAAGELLNKNTLHLSLSRERLRQ